VCEKKNKKVDLIFDIIILGFSAKSGERRGYKFLIG
jgi:hypothetical protein